MAVSWKECLAAFVAGTMAATPFIWSFVFKTAKSLEIFCTWQSQLYFYSPLYLQVWIVLVAVVKMQGREMKVVRVIVPAIGLLTLATLCSSSSLVNGASVLTAVFFVLNLMCLAVLFPLTYGVSLMCCQLVQSYFSSGMLAALMVYYGILFFKIFGALGAFVPFCFFLGFGMLALESLKQTNCFRDGLFSCRAIYVIDSERYVTLGLGQILKKTYRELICLFLLTLSAVVITVCLAKHTEVFIGLSQFNYFFQVGIFFCNIATDSYAAMTTACCVMLSAAIALFCVELSPATSCTVLVLMYAAYFSAQNCGLRILRRNLCKGINQPMVSVIIGSLCNLALTLVFSEFNKCQI